MLLTVTDMGFGKRSSAYEYRVTGRGGQGIANITLAPRNGNAVVATFPVRQGDDVMMVTDAGRLIRVPADQVRITGRQAMGVTLFRVDRRRARHQRVPGAGRRNRRKRRTGSPPRKAKVKMAEQGQNACRRGHGGAG